LFAYRGGALSAINLRQVFVCSALALSVVHYLFVEHFGLGQEH